MHTELLWDGALNWVRVREVFSVLLFSFDLKQQFRVKRNQWGRTTNILIWSLRTELHEDIPYQDAR